MANETEPRALSAALAAPAFVTKGGRLALHSANRHVERWAPEASATRVRSLQNLGFVDRLVAPWIEAAQRSASLRMFSQYLAHGVGERAGSPVSWVFPRPWYQDELDWMAAARDAGTPSATPVAPSLLTTRGTYVAPQHQIRAAQHALPSALYEFVAPSLAVARSNVAASTSSDVWSPLVSVQAAQAAHVMSRAVAPLMASPSGGAAARMSPGLRAVLQAMLERTASAPEAAGPTRLARSAPELVTPPAPRPADEPTSRTEHTIAALAEQRARIVELQRAARIATEREVVAREAARSTEPTARTVEDQLRQRAGEAAVRREVAHTAERAAAQQTTERAAAQQTTERAAAHAAATVERQRLEERIAQRIAERSVTSPRATEPRLHEQARDAAARDARGLIGSVADPGAPSVPAEAAPAPKIDAALWASAMAALPPELASYVRQRPERAAQAIGELGEALRTAELIARNTAAGGTFESARGPRLVMPAGLGSLVATVDQSMAPPRAGGRRTPALATRASASPTMIQPRIPAMSLVAPNRGGGGLASSPAPTSALGATAAASPAALHHVAWADRWLARFAGARPQSLEVLTASAATRTTRLAALASAAPGAVFVAPALASERGGELATAAHRDTAEAARAADHPVVRFDDNAETPDDVFTAIAAAASRSRTVAATAVATTPEAATPTAGFERATLADLVAHAVPHAPGAGLSAQLASSPFAPALRHVMPLGAAPTFDVRALLHGLGATYLAGLLAPATRELAVDEPVPAGRARPAVEWEPTYVAPDAATAVATDPTSPPGDAGEFAATAPLTTLRSALLAWDVDTVATPGHAVAIGAPQVTASSAGSAGGVARSMIEAMSLPMLGSGTAAGAMPATPGTSYAAPGMIADRAHAWSVAQERSSADLAFDFVTPELVLAARVYGLGPAEAAQAARLAIAGPGQLGAMATTVDRTFVQAIAIDAQRRERAASITAYPVSAAAGSREVPASASSGASPTGSVGAALPGAGPTAGPTPSGHFAFGVDRRPPRGAFLWPSATIAALGLSAAAPDGEHSMSVAALELLAAQAVAELGTYAAFVDVAPSVRGEASPRSSSAPLSASSQSPAPAGAPSEDDIVGTAAALVPASRRSKFEAMYVALGHSPTGRSWSPAARAARALALAGRGDETITAHERATVAWDVLPVIYAGALDAGESGAVVSTGAAATHATSRAAAAQRRGLELPSVGAAPLVESRPGLAALSARAGEALGSYVTPSAPSSSPAASPSSSPRDHGAVMRAPTAAQELVRTGRPAGRHGGGETEIPAWFEAAARKMLEDRSGASDGISLAELTLVTSAPASQVAASTRGVPSAAPAVPAANSMAGQQHPGQHIDIEKVANEVYKQILVLMDAARARNGEPYL